MMYNYFDKLYTHKNINWTILSANTNLETCNLKNHEPNIATDLFSNSDSDLYKYVSLMTLNFSKVKKT